MISSRRLTLGVVIAALLNLVAPRPAFPSETVINFDELVVANQYADFPGNQYASSGVLLRTGDQTGNTTIGGLITLNSPVDLFGILSGPGQPWISPLNFAVSSGVGVNDLLMVFTTPVVSVALTSDRFPEGPDVIRLLALAPTADPNQFTILGYDEKLDDAQAFPANRLSIDLGGTPFSYALWQVNSESEGFDDLTFTQAPEPSAVVLFMLGLIGGSVRHRRPRD